LHLENARVVRPALRFIEQATGLSQKKRVELTQRQYVQLVCPLNKADINSLDFVINQFFYEIVLHT